MLAGWFDSGVRPSLTMTVDDLQPNAALNPKNNNGRTWLEKLNHATPGQPAAP